MSITKIRQWANFPNHLLLTRSTDTNDWKIFGKSEHEYGIKIIFVYDISGLKPFLFVVYILLHPLMSESKYKPIHRQQVFEWLFQRTPQLHWLFFLGAARQIRSIQSQQIVRTLEAGLLTTVSRRHGSIKVYLGSMAEVTASRQIWDTSLMPTMG